MTRREWAKQGGGVTGGGGGLTAEKEEWLGKGWGQWEQKRCGWGGGCYQLQGRRRGAGIQ